MPGGYPDMGDGRYTEKAGYKFWYLLNLRMTTHRNYSETVMQMITCFLIAGLFHPVTSIVCSSLYLLLRIAYVWTLPTNF